jgi:hypothetical protein
MCLIMTMTYCFLKVFAWTCQNSWFKIKLDATATDDIERALTQTCCLIEIGLLPRLNQPLLNAYGWTHRCDCYEQKI